MKPLTLFPKILILLALYLLVTGQSHAQDPTTVPFRVNSRVIDARWSNDSTRFTFRSDDDRFSDPQFWYSYDVYTQSITKNLVYPLPAALPTINFDGIQALVWAGVGFDMSVSPKGTYLVYFSNQTVDTYLHSLGIANLRTGEFRLLDINIYGSLAVEWSADETNFTVETQYVTVPDYTQYRVWNLDESLNHIQTEQLTSTIDYYIIHVFDINFDGSRILADIYNENPPRALMAWNPNDQRQLVTLSYDNRLMDAQFSLSNPNIVLAVIGDDLVSYDISGDPIEINRTPLGIPDIRAAYFSPDQTHVAIISDSEYDGNYIVNVLSLPSIQPD